MKKPNRDRLRKEFKAGVKRWNLRLGRVHLKRGRHRDPTVQQTLISCLIRAPENISIYDLDQNQRDYIDTINFLKNIEKNIRARKNCVINFESTSRITAAALVVVYASIESANKSTNKKIEIVWSKKSSQVNSILKTSNLYKLMRGMEFNYALDSSKNIPIISSTGRDQMDEIIDFIQKNIYKNMMTPETEYVYGDAVSETIHNVGLHAYPDSCDDEKRWWLMCEARGKKLYLAIYDRGVGIPKTVVNHPWFMRSLRKLDPTLYNELLSLSDDGSGAPSRLPFQRIPDQKLIQLSMQGDISGTKKDKHGQGSKSIMALVSETSDGVLWVFSNRGVYNFDQEGQVPGLSKLYRKFPGTLVQWNIELP